MRCITLLASLGFVAAVSAMISSGPNLLASNSEIQNRNPREEVHPQERDIGSEHLEERGSSDDSLVARYLSEILNKREYASEYLQRVVRSLGSEELSEREYENLEERNPAIVVRVAVQVIKLIIKAIRAGIEKDKKMRGEWSSHMIARLRSRYPHKNFVVCHTKHSTNFKGIKGKDWGHSHQELKMKMGGTIGFEIYWFKEGTFHRQGDGGYLNWAYGGNVRSTSNGGKDVVFGTI